VVGPEMMIIEAVRTGDLERLQEKAREGVRVETWEPLVTAICEGDVIVMRFLVE
jgi:hypothetical protein